MNFVGSLLGASEFETRVSPCSKGRSFGVFLRALNLPKPTE